MATPSKGSSEKNQSPSCLLHAHIFFSLYLTAGNPPFGANINYSELSSLWEGWLQVVTNTKTEAIINATQKKQMPEYQYLMTQCFSEYYRVLKPNHWITIEFHNSQNSVWNAIQEALQSVGFIVADVRVIGHERAGFHSQV